MWTVLASLTDTRDSTYGHLLQHGMKSAAILLIFVPALTLIPRAKQVSLQKAWGMTISAILAAMHTQLEISI
jgi:hypothetical protein